MIRRAVAADLSGILRTDPLAACGDRARAEFLRRCLDLGQCLVYPGDGAAGGFVVVRPAHFFGRDFVELLAVDPARRRCGIGRALLRAALAEAGTTQVFTSTNTSNQPMRSLLRAERWSFSGALHGLDDRDPELVFYKIRPGRAVPGAELSRPGVAPRIRRAAWANNRVEAPGGCEW